MKYASINEFFEGVSFLEIKFSISKKENKALVCYFSWHDKKKVYDNVFSNAILLSTYKIYRVRKQKRYVYFIFLFLFLQLNTFMFFFINILSNLTAN